MDSAVAAALSVLRDALANSQGKRPVFIQVQVVFSDSTSELHSLSVAPSMPEGASPSRGAKERSARVSELERKVREVLKKADKPLKGEAIALRAKVRYDGRIRSLLAEMVKRGPGEEGRLIHGPRGGYWPADRPLPDGD